MWENFQELKFEVNKKNGSVLFSNLYQRFKIIGSAEITIYDLKDLHMDFVLN